MSFDPQADCFLGGCFENPDYNFLPLYSLGPYPAAPAPMTMPSVDIPFEGVPLDIPPPEFPPIYPGEPVSPPIDYGPFDPSAGLGAIAAGVFIGGPIIAGLELQAGLDPGIDEYGQIDPALYGLPFPNAFTPTIVPDINFPAVQPIPMAPINFPDLFPPLPMEPVVINDPGYVFPPIPEPFRPTDPELLPSGVPANPEGIPAPYYPPIQAPERPAGPASPFPSMPFPLPARSPGISPAPSVSPAPLAPPQVAPTPQPVPVPIGDVPPARTAVPRSPPASEPPSSPGRAQTTDLTVPRSQTVPFRKTKPRPEPHPWPAASPPTVAQADTSQEDCKCNDQAKKRACGEGYFRTSGSGKTDYLYWTKRKCPDRPKGYEPHHGKRKLKRGSHPRHSKHRGGGIDQQPASWFGV